MSENSHKIDKKADTHQYSDVSLCHPVKLPRHFHRNGSLSVIEETELTTFDVKRVYFLYDVPTDSERGGHSHIFTRELLVAVSGSFDLILDDGVKKKKVTLNKPYEGMLITEGIWRTLENFSGGAVCLVMASEKFQEADYVRDYADFMQRTACKRKIRYPFLDLATVNAQYADALKEAAARVIDEGRYIGGSEVERFEDSLASLCQTPYAIGVSNGLDALRLILRSYLQLGRLHEGDEVIVPANTYIATVLAVTDCGLKPVLVDPDEDTCNLAGKDIAPHLTERTKAILTVHLYGRVAWDEEMSQIVRERGLLAIEDNAQAIGARSKSRGLYGTEMTGGLGHAGAISFYPTKNLGALGDGGAIVTHDADLARVARALRNYGSEQRYRNAYAGLNCRLDTLQAAFLNVKLPYLSDENIHRQQIARVYNEQIKNPHVILPTYATSDCVWHQYVVRVTDREDFRKYLAHNGVETDIHYPVPPHKQACYPEFNHLSLPKAEMLAEQVVSLPVSMCTSISDAMEISRIINAYERQ